jgi:hypothetical protein
MEYWHAGARLACRLLHTRYRSSICCNGSNFPDLINCLFWRLSWVEAAAAVVAVAVAEWAAAEWAVVVVAAVAAVAAKYPRQIA